MKLWTRLWFPFSGRETNEIQYDTLKEIMTEYVFSGNISDESIRQHLSDYHFGLLKITKLTEETRAFAYETYKKYKAEGD